MGGIREDTEDGKARLQDEKKRSWSLRSSLAHFIPKKVRTIRQFASLMGGCMGCCSSARALEELAQNLAELRVSMESKLSSLDTRIGGLESRMTDIDSKLSSLDTRIGGLESRMTDIDSKLSSLTLRMDTVESGLREVATAQTETREDRVQFHGPIINVVNGCRSLSRRGRGSGRRAF